VREPKLIADRGRHAGAGRQRSALDFDLAPNDTSSICDHDAQIENVFARFDLDSLL